ncbi:peptidoglycan DD-metalloendopeptidase family protein [Pseudomonadales bacterium]|nr:peptidoglycan DD-metalloendopeptidase family protein [Pseudomonadales bacterium]
MRFEHYPLEPQYTKITQVFGANPQNYSKFGWTNGHEGIDIAAHEGRPVFAVADGEVIWASDKRRSNNARRSAYGNHVVIKHSDRFSTIYAHGTRLATNEGDTVKAGDVIMYAGSTGNSTGPHLHLSVLDSTVVYHNREYPNGYVDPMPYLKPPEKVETVRPKEVLIADHSDDYGGIDIDELIRLGVRGVYIRGAFGMTWKNRFFYHATRYKERGLKVGAYGVVHPDYDGRKQAEEFIKVLSEFETDMPPMIDYEPVNKVLPSVETLRAYHDRLLESFPRVGIYTRANVWDDSYDHGNAYLWIAHYGVDNPDMPSSWDDWTMHQYAGDSFDVSGVMIDANRFNGDFDWWVNNWRNNVEPETEVESVDISKDEIVDQIIVLLNKLRSVQNE